MGLAYKSVRRRRSQNNTAEQRDFLIVASLPGIAPFTPARGLRTSHDVSFWTRLVSFEDYFL